MTRVTFAEPARAEAREARRYYEAISPELARRFSAAFDRAVGRIEADPLLWPPLKGKVRRILFDRFPYALIYQVEGDLVYVLTVMHQSRRPDYWRGR